ncbi:MAG: hypothetical protein M3N08_05165, partial [Pseudomonadota bacterium]|nr:hypothetical protein [Pseudomonadota bacterium]
MRIALLAAVVLILCPFSLHAQQTATLQSFLYLPSDDFDKTTLELSYQGPAKEKLESIEVAIDNHTLAKDRLSET